MNRIISLIDTELTLVEQSLIKTLASHVSIINRVGNHIIASGGKRFRPLLYLLSAKGFHYHGADNIPLACVFEYIHTATLLHDDVIDHAEMRRGNSSANALWGDRISVLVGDFLVSKAFSILVQTGNMQAMRVIAEATTSLAEGETMQTVRGGDLSLTEDDYLAIISNKTASLMAAACQTGAIMGNAGDEAELSMKNFGLNVGIAFQVVDDTLDYVSDNRQFGKPLWKDLQGGKITLPLIHALEGASEQERKIISDSLSHASQETQDAQRILQLINRYQGMEYAFGRAREYVRRAVDTLDGIVSSPVKDALTAAATYVVERKW
jgi:octaprenyl-diphosphate synthase